MKLTFSTLACPNWSLPQIVGAAAAHGYDGIDLRGLGAEIDVTRVSRFGAEIGSTLELLHKHELAIPCLHTSVTLITPAQERWEMMLEECRRYAALAARLGSKFLRVFGGALPKGIGREHAAVMASRHLRQLVKLCGPFACMPIIETHDEWADSARVKELLAEFSPGEAGVLWDIEHPWRRGEAPVETAAALARFIRHVHFKDSRLRGTKAIPCLLGEGELPLSECINALKSIEYGGWICLEVEKRWHPEAAPEPEESLPHFVKYMGAHWGLEKSPPHVR